ncbi:MAG: class I SAM-dependent methyltransferase [Candidatus Asgardarchaeia archaeon]
MEFPKDFEIILNMIPAIKAPYLPNDWVKVEMRERFLVLKEIGITEGMNVLEVGAGHHALTTIPLAYLVGETGRVIAIEIERLRFFERIVKSTNLRKRIIPLKMDAKKLPFPYRCFDYAVIIHGIRSLKNKENIIRILKEMLRVAKHIAIAETLPIALTKAQEAHLEMYNLRHEVFLHAFGTVEDISYFSLDELVDLVKTAGGKDIKAKMIHPNMPHYLAYFPKKYIERIKDKKVRHMLLEDWEKAFEKIQKYGEEHPPVGLVTAFSDYF